MAIDRTAITLTIPLALVLACGSGHLVAQDETSTLGLRLTSSLRVAYGSDPLWAALVPEGEPMPEVKDLDQLPRRSGRFVDGRLNFKAIEAGRYQLRIYRVPTWFAARYPDIQRGRVEEVRDAVPWLIEVTGRLTRVRITREARNSRQNEAQPHLSLCGRLLLDPEIPTERLQVRVTKAGSSYFPLAGALLARAPIDAQGRFVTEFPIHRSVGLVIETPCVWALAAESVELQPEGLTRVGDIDLRGRLCRFTVRVQDPEGRPVRDVTLRTWDHVIFMHMPAFEAPDGVFDLVSAISERERSMNYRFDAHGFGAESIDGLQGDAIVTLRPAPIVRLRPRYPTLFWSSTWRKRFCAVLNPTESPLMRVSTMDDLWLSPHGDLSQEPVEIEVDAEGRYRLEIYRSDPVFYGKWSKATRISAATPSEIDVKGPITEVLVTVGPPILRLRLGSKLAEGIDAAPLWGALVREGTPIPETEYLEDLPELAGRFVNGLLDFNPIAAGRYRLRIFRVLPTWFIRQFPDRRLGRAAEVEGTQPRVIEVEGRLTEVQVTL